MNIFKIFSKDYESIPALFVCIVLAILATVGVRTKLFKRLKTSKINSNDIEKYINTMLTDNDFVDALKSLFSFNCIKDSNTSEEFLNSVIIEIESSLQKFIKEKMPCLPDSISSFIVSDNAHTAAKMIMAYFGYDEQKIHDLFNNYIEMSINTEEQDYTNTAKDSLDLINSVTEKLDELDNVTGVEIGVNNTDENASTDAISTEEKENIETSTEESKIIADDNEYNKIETEEETIEEIKTIVKEESEIITNDDDVEWDEFKLENCRHH